MNDKSTAKGYLMAFLSYLLWGILPIYWHNLSSISSIEILIFRVTISMITLLILIYASKNVLFTSYLKNKIIRNKLILSSLFLATNWGFFIYALSSSHVLQASLGYYINPLISILLGIVFLKEKLEKAKIIAIVLASIGVAYMTFSLGEIPYISLILALSFGLYGFMKKKLLLDSYNSLLVETMFISLAAIVYSIYLLATGTTSIGSLSTLEIVLIIFSGVVTCLPLILFNEGAKRIPLSSLGFLQYLAPTMMLFVGVFLYGESFTKAHAVGFAFIWIGYFIYIFSLILTSRKNKPDKSIP